MPFLRNIVHDLVEKRLWPVAILLAAALVAVPMVLESDPEAASAPATSPSSGAPAGTADVLEAMALTKPERTRLRLDGGPRNPFREPGSASRAPSSSSSGPERSPEPFSDLPQLTDTPSDSGGTSSDIPLLDSVPTVPTIPTTPTTSEDPKQPSGVPTWTLDASFGPLDDLSELTAVGPGKGIPDNEEVLLIFLGSADGRTATFLLSSEATPQEGGTCTPSRRVCRELTLKVGHTAYFDVATGTGTKRYLLGVDKIVKRPL